MAVADIPGIHNRKILHNSQENKAKNRICPKSQSATKDLVPWAPGPPRKKNGAPIQRSKKTLLTRPTRSSTVPAKVKIIFPHGFEPTSCFFITIAALCFHSQKKHIPKLSIYSYTSKPIFNQLHILSYKAVREKLTQFIYIILSMRHIRPRSFLNLVTGGLIIVSLPLVIGLFTTRNHLDKLVSQSVGLVEHSVSSTRYAQELSEYIRNQERNIRLYDIVGETRYLKEASVWHEKIQILLEHLHALSVDQNFQDLLLQFQAYEGRILTSLRLVHQGPKAQERNIARAITHFSDLDKRALAIRSAINEFMNNELIRLKSTKIKAQKTLLWQTLSFILLTIFMILILAYIISQPIKQINRGIDRLGKGDFSTPILITGPKDLEALGRKINWLRRRLFNLEQQKMKFIAHISHDLKTPLASIMEGSGLLREELVGSLNKQQLAVTDILTNNSIKLQKLIDNILDFNMSKVGGKPKSHISIQLKPLIEQVSSEQTTQMMAKNIRLDLHLEDVAISGDQKQLETLLDNLFSNAVKFTPPNGVICCNLKRVQKNIKCIISNTGSTIPPEERNRIFNPFYQINDSDSRHTQGSGLGLAIVKEYIAQHKGSISVLDRKSGTHFMLTFPLLPTK